MILDDLTAFKSYPVFPVAVREKIARYLQKLTPAIPLGKSEIDGENLFAIVSNYATKPLEGSELEMHLVYADIQLLLLGQEMIYYDSVESLVCTQKYKTDNAFYQFNPDSASMVNLAVGKFVVFLPGEGHMPGINSAAGSQDVIKVVIKIHRTLLK